MSVTKLLAVKAVIAAVGLTGGGVALAAATGHMPSVSGGNSSSASSAAHATASHSAGGQSANHPAATPSPSLRGLCQAYTAHAADNPGKSLSNPAFSALITAAGGQSNVSGFCAKTLAAKPGNAHSTHPAGKPSTQPATANTAHPSGKPTAHPSGKPTQHQELAESPPSVRIEKNYPERAGVTVAGQMPALRRAGTAAGRRSPSGRWRTAR
jgi:hypothetical protein